MKLNEIFLKVKKANKKSLMFSQMGVRDYILRHIGVYLSVIFIKCKLHPTAINIFNFFLGLLALITIFLDHTNLKISTLFFLLAYFFDLTDGNVARFKNIASFWGRFLDSVIDILVGGFFYVVLFYYSLLNFNSLSILILAIFALLFHPIYHMIYDKYSSLARWSNLDNKTNIAPYIRLTKGKNITLFFLDTEFLLLISLLFINEKKIIFYVICMFFIIGILKFLFNLILHTYYSRKNMIYSKNQKRNN